MATVFTTLYLKDMEEVREGQVDLRERRAELEIDTALNNLKTDLADAEVNRENALVTWVKNGGSNRMQSVINYDEKIADLEATIKATEAVKAEVFATAQ